MLGLSTIWSSITPSSRTWMRSVCVPEFANVTANVVDGQRRVLLFRFSPYDGRPPFWCTPGGKVDDGETYEQAARRELLEEVGLDTAEACGDCPRVVLGSPLAGESLDLTLPAAGQSRAGGTTAGLAARSVGVRWAAAT